MWLPWAVWLFYLSLSSPDIRELLNSDSFPFMQWHIRNLFYPPRRPDMSGEALWSLSSLVELLFARYFLFLLEERSSAPRSQSRWTLCQWTDTANVASHWLNFHFPSVWSKEMKCHASAFLRHGWKTLIWDRQVLSSLFERWENHILEKWDKFTFR